MNIEQYRERRLELLKDTRPRRIRCVTCLQPHFSCYCEYAQTFDPKIKFVILIHPIEARRRIATGRLAHMCIEKSLLFKGVDYTKNDRLNQVLNDPQYQPVVLYPGKLSLNLTNADHETKSQIFAADKTPLIVVIDGTWATARKMIRRSLNLVNLPRICFTPESLSQFHLRKQPRPECYSTIEAIHHTIDLLAPYTSQTREHDKLLECFKKMVNQQLSFRPDPNDPPKLSRYKTNKRLTRTQVR